MKKKKILRNASFIALSAVMLCGTAVAAVGCDGKSNDLEISVDIFCNDLDAATNKKICDDWAVKYTEILRANGTIGETDELEIDFNYTTSSETYFEQLKLNFVDGTAADVIYISPKFVKAYSQIGRVLDISAYMEKTDETIAALSDVWSNALSLYGHSTNANYMQGEKISYNTDSGKFETDDGIEVGLYGLPKDYSNFGLGFNNIFFSEKLREAFTTTLPSASRSVTGAEYDAANLTYTGSGDEEIVTDALTGKECPIIQIGKPTNYRPYNFYRYGSYQEAVTAGDPVATAVEEYTDGEGYTVTIPGWPGDTFKITDSSAIAENAAYDATVGYITYTYAEYSALSWAVSYYMNTFDWDSSDPTKGQGGVPNSAGTNKNVYANDQYDGALYLLPWLASNDANYLTADSKSVVNGTDSTKVGTATETTPKLRLNGEYEDVAVQYGSNSERFIETYGAFCAYNSDWNGSSNFADSASKDSGWDLFCGGSVIFYGAGTWDAATRNNSDYNYFQFRQMPEPVAERYALYSNVKNAYYEMQEYGTLKEFTQEDITANQITRQDKWAARMDSVGYGVNGSLVKTASDWKIAACVSLIQDLTINTSVQKDLTYGGAQLPNFVSMTQDFLYYNDKNYANYANGTFNDMITPEGDAEGNDVWDEYYAIVKAMAAASNKGGTIGEFMTKNYPDKKYNASYKDTPMTSITGYSTAMKVLNMTTYVKADRDLAIRMQTGLNAVRDPSTYVYLSDWINELDARGDYLMAYTTKDSKFVFTDKSIQESVIKTVGTTITTGSAYGTPAVWLLNQTAAAQNLLNESIKEEDKFFS